MNKYWHGVHIKEFYELMKKKMVSLSWGLGVGELQEISENKIEMEMIQQKKMN